MISLDSPASATSATFSSGVYAPAISSSPGSSSGMSNLLHHKSSTSALRAPTLATVPELNRVQHTTPVNHNHPAHLDKTVTVNGRKEKLWTPDAGASDSDMERTARHLEDRERRDHVLAQRLQHEEHEAARADHEREISRRESVQSLDAARARQSPVVGLRSPSAGVAPHPIVTVASPIPARAQTVPNLLSMSLAYLLIICLIMPSCPSRRNHAALFITNDFAFSHHRLC
jgi:hypothetical protein